MKAKGIEDAWKEEYQFYRFEIQLKKPKLYELVRKLRSGEIPSEHVPVERNLATIATLPVERHIFHDYIVRLTGRGDYITYDAAWHKIARSDFSKKEQQQLCGLLKQIQKEGGVAAAISETDNVRNVRKLIGELEELGINPVTIPNSMVKEYGCTKLPNLVTVYEAQVGIEFQQGRV